MMKTDSKSSGVLILLGIILLAAGLRVYGLSFGLPALYDPDEPTFVLSALRLLRDQTLNPGWFGHPGSTTIYTLAVIDLVVLAVGLVSGRFANAASFSHAIYTDPAVAFLPGRVFMLVCGLACIWLTFLIGQRLFDRRVGLLAALLLTVDPLHVKYSQIIRTDMHATVFMLLCILAAIGIANRGLLRDYLSASLWLGFACATKWPAATVMVCILGAAILRAAQHPEERRIQLRNLCIAGVASWVALFAASPYLFLDYPTMLANLHGEARPYHLGATGSGPWANAWWYLTHALRDAIGSAGLVLCAVGASIASQRSRIFLATVMPVGAVFFTAICLQALIWERWVVPLLPLLTIAAAVAITALTRRIGGYAGTLAAGVICIPLILPSLVAIQAGATERANDTRAKASAWARTHIPAGSTVLVEHFAIDLLDQPWRFLFPLGEAGCVDGAAMLRGRIRLTTVDRLRQRNAVVDLGTINPSTLAGCRADFAILTDYDRYRLEAGRYPRQLAIYERVIAAGKVVRTFQPKPGESGGPIVRIVRMDMISESVK